MSQETALAARSEPSIGALRKWGVLSLRNAGNEGAQLDARILLAHATGVDAAELLARPDTSVDQPAQKRFQDAIARRVAGEPVARIVGAKEFWSREFAILADVFVPRPDTEIIVEAALAAKPDRDEMLRVLDLGIGTGVLLGAILLERPRAFGVGVDRSAAALHVARRNLAALGLDARADVLCGDWACALGGEFDLIVANPPYVASGDVGRLPREVRDHDPRIALDGGPDGLAAYREILRELPRLLAPRGAAVLELGHGQHGPVAAIARDAHLVVNGPRLDLAGRPRALIFGVGQAKKPLGSGGEPL
jgi:release factor glutamine methyltransferase